MAISFVGSYAASHAATSAQSIALSNLRDANNSQPTLQEGDLVVVSVNNASTADRTQAQLLPSGYTAAHTDLYANDSNDTNLQVGHKFMAASPDTTVTIPASDSTANGVAFDIHVFRGVDTANPLDVTTTTATGTNTGVANAPSITPISSGAWIMAVGAAGVAAGAVFTNPAGLSTTTNHFRSATITTTTVDANIGAGLKTDWTSGAFDPAAFGGSTSTNTGSWAAVTLALRPLLTPITATASPTINTFLSASAAKALIKGTGGGTLNAFTLSAAGSVHNPSPITATASPTLGTFLSTAAVKALVEGTGSGTLNAFTASGAAKVKIVATAAPSINAFLASGIARVRVKAVAAPAVNTFISAAAAKSLIEGTGGGTLNAFAAIAGGSVRVRATASVQLSPFTSQSAAKIKISGDADATLSSFTSGAQAKALLEGFGAGILNPFAASGVAAIKITASGSPTLSPFTAEGSIGGITAITAVASPTLNPFLSSAAVSALIDGTGGGTLNEFSVQGNGRVRVTGIADVTISEFGLSSVGDVLSPPDVPEKYIAYPRIRLRIIPVVGRRRIVDRPAINRIITARITSMDSLLTRTWQPKRAGETDYRGVNWKNELASGETITDYNFVPEGVTLEGKSIDGTKTIASLSGGEAESVAETVASITTSTGRILEVLCKMRVE